MDTGDHEIEVPLRSGAPSGADGTGATDPLALLNIVGLDELSKPVPPMTFVVDQLLPSDSVVVVAGPAGAQKSWLALEACVSVGAGDSCMGRFRSELGFALYMNFEAGRHAVRRRFHKLVAARGYWPPNILFAELPDAGPADPSFLTALKAVMDRYQPKLVAVDTYRASMPGIDENDSAVRQYIDPLRRVGEQAGTCFLFAAHTRKLGDRRRSLTQDDVRGSGALVEAADTAFLLSKPKNDGPSILTHVKPRDVPRLEDHDVRLVDHLSGGVSLVATPSALAATIDKQQKMSHVETLVFDFIAMNAGCNKRALRSLPGNNSQLDEAVRALVDRGDVINRGADNAHSYFVASPQACPP